MNLKTVILVSFWSINIVSSDEFGDNVSSSAGTPRADLSDITLGLKDAAIGSDEQSAHQEALPIARLTDGVRQAMAEIRRQQLALADIIERVCSIHGLACSRAYPFQLRFGTQDLSRTESGSVGLEDDVVRLRQIVVGQNKVSKDLLDVTDAVKRVIEVIPSRPR